MMRAAWLLLLLAALLLGAEALRDNDGMPGPPPSAPSAAAPPPPRRAATGEDAGLQAAVLARPLFSPSRRPLAEGAIAPPTGQTEPESAAAPRLAGIVVSAASRTAIFVRPEDGRSVTLSEGGRIGEETVLRIEPGQVTLEGPAGRRVARTSIDTAAPPPPPEPPPAAANTVTRSGTSRRGVVVPLQTPEE